MSPSEGTEKEQARLRAELIVKVRSGLLSAAEAAKRMGVSRKTYYKWEERALSAMIAALQDRDAGRPGRALDEAQTQMRLEIEGLKKQLLLSEQNQEIHSLLHDDLGLMEDKKKE